MSDTLAHSLALGVARVFSKINVNAEDLLTGKLNNTEMVWQIPPIICEESFNGVPFSDYFEVNLKLKEDVLFSFYQNTMLCLRNATHKVLGKRGYLTENAGIKAGKREMEYWFSFPEGAPDRLIDTAGALFSMECANVFKVGGAAMEVYESDDDYWVVTKSGHEVGVRDGYPLLQSDEWDNSVAGVVPDLLRMPRGEVYVGCDYDVVSKVRSYLQDNKDKLKREDFECADYALQILRVIGLARSNDILLPILKNIKEIPFKSERKKDLLKDALSLAMAGNVSDRSKITGLRNLLVPEIFTRAAFTKNVYSYISEVPPMLRKGEMERIQTNLELLLEQEMRE